MRARHIIELTIDLANPAQETALGIHAVLNCMANKGDQINMLQLLQAEIDAMLKGVESDGQQVL